MSRSGRQPPIHTMHLTDSIRFETLVFLRTLHNLDPILNRLRHDLFPLASSRRPSIRWT